MAELRVRDVPEKVHKDLRRMALEADLTLNELIVRLLVAATAKAGRA